MPTDSRNPDPMVLIDRAIASLSDAIAGTQAALAIVGTLESTFECPLNDLKTSAEIQAEHRRNHRRGRPSKIEGDPELEAFIAARIDTLTFAQIVCEVRSTFPPDRQCGHSGLGRWWQKRRGR